MTEPRPRVSICLPAYNAADTIEATLDSVWAQTFSEFEVVVVDDASTDETLRVLGEQRDERLKVVRYSKNGGCASNTNRTVKHATGGLIKFVDADDLLHPECLAKMVSCFDGGGDVGMAFCRRRLLLEDPTEEWSLAWSRDYGDLTAPFGGLAPVNDGMELFSRWVAGRLDGNWIGEPVTVMVRRDVLDQVGGFNERLRHMIDRDLWVRVVPTAQVAFLDEELATYRVRGSSISRSNQGAAVDWLDRLWMFEGLRVNGLLGDREPRLHALLAEERAYVLQQLRDLVRRPAPARWLRLGDAMRFGLWRLRAQLRPGLLPYGTVEAVSDR